jgi:tetratricopeptide (TPR) repeat protein
MANRKSSNRYFFRIAKAFSFMVAASLALGILWGESILWPNISSLAQTNAQLPTTTAQEQNRIAAREKLDEAGAYSKQGTAEAWRTAQKKYEEALLLAEAAADLDLQARAFNGIGVIHSRFDENPKSREALTRALNILRSGGDYQLKADILINLGRILIKLQDLPNADDSFEQARLLYKNANNPEGEAKVLSGIGAIQNELNNHVKAIEYFSKARQIWKSLGKYKEEAIALSNIGALYDEQGNDPDARKSYLEALSAYVAAGDRDGQATMHFYIGRVCKSEGKYKEALIHFNGASGLWNTTDVQEKKAKTLNEIGLVYMSGSDPNPKAAIKVYREALSLWQSLKNQEQEAHTYNYIGLAYTALITRNTDPFIRPPNRQPFPGGQISIMSSQQREAIGAHENALKIWRVLENKCMEANTYGYLNIAYRKAGDIRQADSYRNRATTMFEENHCSNDPCSGGSTQEQIVCNQRQRLRILKEGKPNEKVAMHFRLGQLYSQSDKQKAIQYISEGLYFAQKTPDRQWWEMVAGHEFGWIYYYSGEMDKAVESFRKALSLFKKEPKKIKRPSLQASVLNGLGECYRKLRRYEEALGHYGESLELSQKHNDRRLQGVVRNNLGLVYQIQGNWEKAIELYQEAIKSFRAVPQTSEIANTLGNLALVYRMQGDLTQARDCLNESLVIWREVKNSERQAYTFRNLGLVFTSLGDYENALGSHRQAYYFWKTHGKKKKEEALALGAIARLYDLLGNWEKAIDSYELALELWQDLGSRRAQASALKAIGQIYDSLGKNQTAEIYRERAQALLQPVTEGSDSEKTLDALSQKDLASLQETLTLLRSTDSVAQARILNYIGDLFFSAGEARQSLSYYRQGLEGFRAAAKRREEGLTLNAIARVHQSLKEWPQAIDNYRQAVDIFRDADAGRDEARSRSYLGDAYASSKDHQRAAESYRQSVELFKKLKKEERAAVIPLERLGKMYESLKKDREALDVYQQALALWGELKRLAREADLLIRMGKICENLSEKLQAREYYDLARQKWHEVGDPNNEASALYSLARLDRTLGKLDNAKAEIAAAVDLIESVRARVISQQSRISYLESNHKYYEFYIDLLMQLHTTRPAEGFDRLALQMSERSRARSLLDTLVESRAEIHEGVDAKLLGNLRALKRDLNEQALKRFELQGDENANKEELAAISKQIVETETELEKLEVQIKQSSPRYAALTQPSPLTLVEIQQQILDADTLLLEYALGEDRSFVWAITQTNITGYTLAGRSEIEADAKRVHKLLSTGPCKVDGESSEHTNARANRKKKEYLEASSKLSQMLLGPVSGHLGNKRLLIVADGILHTIPFQALPDPNAPLKTLPSAITPPATTKKPENQRQSGARQRRSDQTSKRGQSGSTLTPGIDWQPLVVDHEIVSLPSISTLAVSRRELALRPRAKKMIAMMAVPVFENDDLPITKNAQSEEQIQKTTLSPDTNPIIRRIRDLLPASACRGDKKRWSRLDFVEQEAKRIVALDSTNLSMIALGIQVNRALVEGGRLSEYQIRHCATHGLADSEYPGLSTILLSLFDEQGKPQDGYLRAHEIYNLNLGADLVVLSACQTGLGKEVKGEGVISLTRGFMYAGAARVVVSLWNVNDQATAELMETFYRKMLREGKRPAKALQEAQREMWQQQRLEAPYYWAAFTLQGEWR